MTHFQAVYYRTADEREPVRVFIASLDDEARAAINRQVGRLNLLDDRIPHLPFPHSSQIEGELRELRCHYGRNLYRVLYRRSDRLLVVLHVFAKRSAKIPEGDIAVAQQRWDDFKERMDAGAGVRLAAMRRGSLSGCWLSCAKDALTGSPRASNRLGPGPC